MISKGLNFLTFLIIGIFLLLEFNSYLYIKVLKNKIEVKAFLEDDANYYSLSSKIEKLDGVKEIIFVSKEQALQEFKRDFKDSTPFLREMDENPLPASFKIILRPECRTTEYIDSIRHSIKALQGIKEVVYGKGYTQSVCAISSYFKQISSGIGGLLFLSLIFTLAVTLKERASTLKNKLASLKVNTTPDKPMKAEQTQTVYQFNGYRWKFSLRNFIEGVLLSGIAMLAIYYIYKFVLVKIAGWVTFLPVNFILGFIGGCGMLTFIISLIVIRKKSFQILDNL
ncbi:MAG: permease-like cell division protein FtsX [bacterium]|nr:permease-like cell division protein FtsX [bacterium]